MSLIWQDYATDERQSRLWVKQHPVMVGTVQLGVTLAAAALLWTLLLGLGRFAWLLAHPHLGIR